MFGEKKQEQDARHDLLGKCRTIEELDEVMGKYGPGASIYFHLAGLLRLQTLRFEAVDQQIKVLEKQVQVLAKDKGEHED